MAAALFLASTLLTKRLTTWPTRRTLPIGAVLIAAGATLNDLLATNPATLIPGLILTGAGLGLTGPATSTVALAVAPPDRAGMASGALATAASWARPWAWPPWASPTHTASARSTWSPPPWPYWPQRQPRFTPTPDHEQLSDPLSRIYVHMRLQTQ